MGRIGVASGKWRDSAVVPGDLGKLRPYTHKAGGDTCP